MHGHGVHNYFIPEHWILIIRKFVAEKQHDVYKEKCFTNIFRHAWVYQRRQVYTLGLTMTGEVKRESSYRSRSDFLLSQ